MSNDFCALRIASSMFINSVSSMFSMLRSNKYRLTNHF